jgi:hypothetical protein
VDDIQYSKDDYTAFELGRFEGLDEDAEWQIVQAYLKKLQSGGKNAHLTINDVWVEKYFGVYCPAYISWDSDYIEKNYNGIWDWDAIYHGTENQTVFAVMMGDQDNGTEQQEVSIRHWYGRAFVRDGNRIFLWHNGKLYNLEDHYDFNSGGLLFSWNFLEIANLQNGLDIETQSRIQEDYGKSMPRPWLPGYYYEIGIQYLGTYNGYIVVIAYIGTNADLGHLEIDGVHFYYSSGGHRIFAWKEGQVYELQDLYKRNLITREDLVQMAYNLHAVVKEEE